ncbi:hypothetical protein D187_004203 [Cystobacter fuscus DSM 2262]|uniref:Novel toxin 15 domain-containing protein n=1 Tax=Cystobacter fuscus (strain ATCC 25194 / DSM 2262 / NBRC 100088 / M29) TaxID=1242864 RepID=S9P4R5_CYSF2|nr:hypothetical protein D187_004203 [Cystobacter fuscus DSM 2262]
MRRQQDAINEMSVDKFESARKSYKDALKATGSGRNPDAQRAREVERAAFEEKIRDSLMESMKNDNKGLGYRELKNQASARAKDIMSTLDALHEPDMVTGGWSKSKPEGMGDASVNSAIGASWNQKDRLSTIDAQAKQASDAKQGHAKMNVKLEVCRGRRYCP